MLASCVYSTVPLCPVLFVDVAPRDVRWLAMMRSRRRRRKHKTTLTHIGSFDFFQPKIFMKKNEKKTCLDIFLFISVYIILLQRFLSTPLLIPQSNDHFH